MFTQIEKTFHDIVPQVDFCSLRLVREQSETLMVRHDVVEPVRQTEDLGAMITIHHNGGMGYGATPDLSASGLRSALEQARYWAQATAGRNLVGLGALKREPHTGEYRTKVLRPWTDLSLEDRLDLLRKECARPSIAWPISIWNREIPASRI
jgi:predicted Zn-dependent protease